MRSEVRYTFSDEEVDFVMQTVWKQMGDDFKRDQERLKVIQSKIAKFDDVVELMQAALEGAGHKKLSDIIMKKIEELK